MSSSNVFSQEKLEGFIKRLSSEEPLLNSFRENPLDVLEKEGIPKEYFEASQNIKQYAKDLGNPKDMKSKLMVQSNGGADVQIKEIKALGVVLGYNFILSDKVCKDMRNGLTDISGALSSAVLLSMSTGPLAVVIGAISAGISLKGLEIGLMNRGTGVYFPITWFQIAEVAMGGPAAAALFIHPLPN